MSESNLIKPNPWIQINSFEYLQRQKKKSVKMSSSVINFRKTVCCIVFITIGCWGLLFYLTRTNRMCPEPESSIFVLVDLPTIPKIPVTQPEETGFYLEKCKCHKHRNSKQIRLRSELPSTCSDEADWRGKGQHVISFGFFNQSAANHPANHHLFSEYVDGILKNVERIKSIYPDWSIRIYSNHDLNSESCAYACMDEIIWCDIRDPRFDGMEKVNPRLWRFNVIGDPTVDIFLSRDLDSWITEREREVVEEWAASNFTFHCARDGLRFSRAISAGTLGVKNYDLSQNESKSLREELMRRGVNNKAYELDEDLLEELIFNQYSTRILVHDSYTCKKYHVPSVPFPKQRKNRGTRLALQISWKDFQADPCPIECRPSYGKNWTYC